MDEQIKVIFIANAGVLIEFQGTKLLIDGIYAEDGHSFSCVSQGQWDRMKNGNGIFANIDYLLFTHEHEDHFSPQKVAEYMEFQKPKAIFVPKEGSSALQELQMQAERLGVPCAALYDSFCQKTMFMPEKGIRIKVLSTKHLDKRYEKVPHFCYLLQLGEKHLLFTGDMDFKSEQMAEVQDVFLDAIFINPLMNHSREGRDFLQNHIRTKRKIVYHIPFAGEDNTLIRLMAEKDLLSRKGEDTIFLMETEQEQYL